MTQTKLMWSNLGPIRANMALDHVPKQAAVYKLTFKLWGILTLTLVKLALAVCGRELATTRTILLRRATRRSIFYMIFCKKPVRRICPSAAPG